MWLHLSYHIRHTVCVFYLDLSPWIKKSITCSLWYITHSQHDIWDWCNNLVLSWLMSVNEMLLLWLDSKLISKAHFIQSIKVNIVPSHTNSLPFQSRYVHFSTIKSCCNLRLLPLDNFSSLFSMEEEVAVQDVFKTASSAQKSLVWKNYLIFTMKNTTTHHHCAKCRYCNVVMDG